MLKFLFYFMIILEEKNTLDEAPNEFPKISLNPLNEL